MSGARPNRRPVEREGTPLPPDDKQYLRRLGLARGKALAKKTGLDEGRYFQDAQHRQEHIMRCGDFKPRERVRAWIQLHTMAIAGVEHSTVEGRPRYHGRCVMKLVGKAQKKVPATIWDCALETGMDESNVRRELKSMEKETLEVKLRKNDAGEFVIFSYVKPGPRTQKPQQNGPASPFLPVSADRLVSVTDRFETQISIGGIAYPVKLKIWTELVSPNLPVSADRIKEAIQRVSADLVQRVSADLMEPVSADQDYKDVSNSVSNFVSSGERAGEKGSTVETPEPPAESPARPPAVLSFAEVKQNPPERQQDRVDQLFPQTWEKCIAPLIVRVGAPPDAGMVQRIDQARGDAPLEYVAHVMAKRFVEQPGKTVPSWPYLARVLEKECLAEKVEQWKEARPLSATPRSRKEMREHVDTLIAAERAERAEQVNVLRAAKAAKAGKT